MQEDLNTDEILALLEWQRAMGADSPVSEQPVDWLARGPQPLGAAFQWPDREETSSEPPRPEEPARTGARATSAAVVSPSPPRTEAVRPQTPLAPSAAETEARRAASAATSLEALEQALRAFDGCSLKATAKNLCFYRGAAQASLMLIGEAPGRDEDIEGKPFVGRAGQLLDKMLAAIDLAEADVHITNIVYWRPPGNRTPTPQEALACKPFLERQIELVAPKIIVALGGAAAKEILGATEGIMRLRGKWRALTCGRESVAAIATLHPAYLLRTPAAKQAAWQDLLAIKARLAAEN